MSKRVELLGLRIRCPRAGRVVNVPRDKYHIGPLSNPKKRAYEIDCACGLRHRIRTAPYKLPPKGQLGTLTGEK